jgi:hypothetical protein
VDDRRGAGGRRTGLAGERQAELTLLVTAVVDFIYQFRT